MSQISEEEMLELYKMSFGGRPARSTEAAKVRGYLIVTNAFCMLLHIF